MSAPRLRSVSIAGSTSASDKPSFGTRGRQAAPPFNSVSRSTAPNRQASASCGRVFSAATDNGSSSNQYSELCRMVSDITVSSHSRPSLRICKCSLAVVLGTRRSAKKIHHGNRPRLGRSVHSRPVFRSTNGNTGLRGPVNRSRAPIASI